MWESMSKPSWSHAVNQDGEVCVHSEVHRAALRLLVMSKWNNLVDRGVWVVFWLLGTILHMVFGEPWWTVFSLLFLVLTGKGFFVAREDWLKAKKALEVHDEFVNNPQGREIAWSKVNE